MPGLDLFVVICTITMRCVWTRVETILKGLCLVIYLVLEWYAIWDNVWCMFFISLSFDLVSYGKEKTSVLIFSCRAKCFFFLTSISTC